MKTLKIVSSWSLSLLSAVIMMTSVVYAQDKTPELTDAEIASVAVTANQIDVNYGKIALKISKDKEIKHFAQTMMNDHTNIIKKAADLAKELGVTPKDNAVTQSLLQGEKTTAAKLNQLKGKEFDKAYVDNEVAYHQAVIDAVKTLLIPQTDNEILKDLLVQVLPLLDHHLEMAKMMQAKFKN